MINNKTKKVKLILKSYVKTLQNSLTCGIREIKKVCKKMIQPVSALSPEVFKGNVVQKKNTSASKIMGKRIAIANAAGTAVLAGALTTAISRSYTASWKHAGLFGIGAAFITMLFVSPKFLYNKNIKTLDAISKEKEIPKKAINKMKRI